MLVYATEDKFVEEMPLLYEPVLTSVAERAPIEDLSKNGLGYHDIHVLLVAVLDLIEGLEDCQLVERGSLIQV